MIFRWLLAGSVVLLGLQLGACIDAGAFACTEDRQCDHVAGAVCVEGYCAVEDDACESGYRFDGAAASDLANNCVMVAATTGAETTTSATVPLPSTATQTSAPTSTVGADPSTSSSTASSSSETAAAETAASTGRACEFSPCACTDKLDVGTTFNCVLRDDASVVCWGRNQFGQLGGNTPPGPLAVPWPQSVTLPEPAIGIGASGEHACALLMGGRVSCWGRNIRGSVDPSQLDDALLPPTIFEGVEDGIRIRLGHRTGCVLLEDDRLTCFGRNTSGELIVEGPDGAHTSGPHMLRPVVDFAVGTNFGCMWSDEEVRCWGANNRGQLGRGVVGGPPDPEPAPVQLPDVSPVHVCVGHYHACASTTDGSIYCWGDNASGQSGPLPSQEPLPVLIEGDWTGNVVGLVSHRLTNCALFDDGDVYCWGGPSGASLGARKLNGVPLWPPLPLLPAQELTELPEFFDVGTNHICVQLPGGRLQCWGSDAQQQLGGLDPPAGKVVVELDLECLRE